jgi:transcription elongation factor GreA-like protein
MLKHLAAADVPKMVKNLRRQYARLSNMDRYLADKELSQSFKTEIR